MRQTRQNTIHSIAALPRSLRVTAFPACMKSDLHRTGIPGKPFYAANQRSQETLPVSD